MLCGGACRSEAAAPVHWSSRFFSPRAEIGVGGKRGVWLDRWIPSRSTWRDARRRPGPTCAAAQHPVPGLCRSTSPTWPGLQHGGPETPTFVMQHVFLKNHSTADITFIGWLVFVSSAAAASGCALPCSSDGVTRGRLTQSTRLHGPVPHAPVAQCHRQTSAAFSPQHTQNHCLSHSTSIGSPNPTPPV